MGEVFGGWDDGEEGGGGLRGKGDGKEDSCLYIRGLS